MTEQDRHPKPAFDHEIEEILRTVEGEIPEPVVALPRKPLDAEERTIKDILVRMGSIIEERIRLTVEALETHDAEKALFVIRGDEEVNALQVEATDRVVLTIATQAPVARDLRFLLALDRIGYELERIGALEMATLCRETFGARLVYLRTDRITQGRDVASVPFNFDLRTGKAMGLPAVVATVLADVRLPDTTTELSALTVIQPRLGVFTHRLA